MMSPAENEKRDFSFPATERLSGRQEFAGTLKDGRKISGENLTLYYLRVEGEGRKFGVIVGKRAGGAVARNRIKRILRESYRHSKNLLPAGIWLILRWTPPFGATPHNYHRTLGKELRKQADALLAELAGKPEMSRQEAQGNCNSNLLVWRGWTYSLLTAPIRLWQTYISKFFPPSCRYHPSCSSYALQALAKYGLLRGSVKSMWRLLRCNPFSAGGYDPP